MRGGDDMLERSPEEGEAWKSLNSAAVLLNKWTQRTMYTLQTSVPDSPIEHGYLEQKLRDAVALVMDVCAEVS
jgi:hypothetical protein